MELKLKNKVMNTVLDTILNNRNLTNEKVDWLLNANELNWENYNNYTDIHRAYMCLKKNINKDNKIGILVDTDVDGYCSSAELFMFIRDDLKYENVFYIQHTKKEKVHGLTREIIDKALDLNLGLIITPDSASEHFKEQKELNEKGIDFIALDHHMYNIGKVPKTSIIVNNKDGKVENVDGSGAAVTYKFIRYVADRRGIDIGYKYVDLVNVANISDSTDMRSLENRYFFNIGKDIDNISNKLIISFLSDLRVKNYLKIDDVIWGIAPVINAIIRNGTIEDRELLFKAVIGEDETVTYKSKGVLKEQSLQDAIIRIGKNYKRKQKDLTDKAIKGEVKLYSKEDDKVVLINSDSIDTKVTGLVANKFMGIYNKPILMMRDKEENKNNYTGSVRCPNYIEDFKSICDESGLFNWCQGHGNSFGYELPKKNLKDFIDFINKKLKDINTNNSVEIDFIFENNIDMNDLISIGQLEDVWCGTLKRPKFLMKNVVINTKNIKKFGVANYSFMRDKILFKKDFCSKVFFSKMIDEENNEFKNKDIKMDILFSIKNNDKGFAYVDIIDVESKALEYKINN